MIEILMLIFVILFFGFWIYLYFRCERLVDEIIQHKAPEAKKSSFVSWMMGGFLLLFHIGELASLKSKYLADDDYGLIDEYRKTILLYWVFIIWFLVIVTIEMTTSF